MLYKLDEVKMEIILVPGAGIEPAHSQGARDFKSLASTNSAIPATGFHFMLYAMQRQTVFIFMVSRRLFAGV